MELQQKPICFVAHNGNRFDYPILREHCYRLGNELSNDLLCIDSLDAFREIYKNEIIDKESHIKITSSEENIQLEIETNTTKQVTNIPIEFLDGYDEILTQAVEQIETSTDHKFTVAEIQKINETTPTKNNRIVNLPISKNRNKENVSSKVKRRLTNR